MDKVKFNCIQESQRVRPMAKKVDTVGLITITYNYKIKRYYINYKHIFKILYLFKGDSDVDTDEDEAHIDGVNVVDKYSNLERDKNEDTTESGKTELNTAHDEVSVSLLRAKNLSLLQSP